MNHKHLLFCVALCVLWSLVLSSCDDPTDDMEEDTELGCESLTDASIQTVTGIRFFDENGNPIGLAGNPNVDNDRDFLVYPNPCGPVLSLGQIDVESWQVYFIPAAKDTACSDIAFDGASFSYSESALEAAASRSLPFAQNGIQINMDGLVSDAFYKIVLLHDDGRVLVENIYYSRDRVLNDVYIELLEAF